MKKIIALFLFFVFVTESVEEKRPQKLGYIQREYWAFVEAFKQMRQSGFKSCSSSQKKRIVIVGLVGTAGALFGSRGMYVLLSKQVVSKEFLFPQTDDEYLQDFSAPEIKERIAITVDLDEVLSGNEIDTSRLLWVVCKLIVRHPIRAFRIIPHLYSLKKQGVLQSKSMKGASNIIQKILESPDDQSCDLAPDYLNEIIARAINPRPIKDMVYLIASLKKAGYRVIGATNQDYIVFKTYQAKMNDLGINTDDLFDWVLTTKADSQELSGEQHYGCMHEDKKVFMLKAGIAKPDKAYYQIVQEIERNVFDRNSTLCVHIDDRLENVHGAQSVAGFDGIQMHLSHKLFFTWTKGELSSAVEQLKRDLATKGIVVGPRV